MATLTASVSVTKSKEFFEIESQKLNVDIDDNNTTSSILEFLNREQECFNGNFDDNNSDIDVESIFEEINRLSDNTDERSVDEIIREAEFLISKQAFVIDANKTDISNDKRDLKSIKQNKFEYAENVSVNISNRNIRSNEFCKVVDEVQPDSVISDESTPKDMHLTSLDKETEDDGDTTDTIEDISEGIARTHVSEEGLPSAIDNTISTNKLLNNCERLSTAAVRVLHTENREKSIGNIENNVIASNQPSPKNAINYAKNSVVSEPSKHQKLKSGSAGGGGGAFVAITSPMAVINKTFTRPSSTNKLHGNFAQIGGSDRTFCDKYTNLSPKKLVSAITSPIDCMSITREHALKNEIEQLQEKLKDTEERLQSLRLQHDSLSHIHRDLRESNTQLQEQSELLKLDVQHLTECANILRSELSSARSDRNDALELQKILHIELEDSRTDKKKVLELKEKDTKIIQDLQRQCREMERILMRKHPDSVSALIVASKNPLKHNDDNSSSRRLLEQRIAQLERDAQEQDLKAQKILANVQARFNSVQSKYETHIADLETQVLSLQEINAKLNEKIEYQIQTLNCIAAKTSGENLVNNCTQTVDIPEKEARMLNSGTQTDNSAPTTANQSGGQTTRSVNKQSGIKKPSASLTGKMPSSHSDSTIAAYQAAAKEDAHLLATIRGMRVDLAIKDKAMQRLTREVEECKKTIKKLQKERDVLKSEKPNSASSSSSMSSRKVYDPNQLTDHTSDSQAIKEALNKIKLLEFDYKSLHDKRLQDLKTLQTAHERELASCHETVRILQQRLTERDEAFASQKRRKVPVDYYALKAKVSSLERRHSEREERLHMLVEALSKGRLNGALDDILSESSK